MELSRKNSKFDPTILNNLIENEEKPMEVSKIVENQNVVQKYEEPSEIYKQLAYLIESANDILGQIKYMIESDSDTSAELINSYAALMNSIKDTLKEFTKIHLMNLKFEKMKELEDKKFEQRKELLKLRDKKNDDKETVPLIPYTQEEIIKLINED